MISWQRAALVLTAFVCILLTHLRCLNYPPYEDQALGLWAEAQFLADHNFDYYRLRYEEKNLMDGGGSRSYMISLLPTLAALLLKATPRSTDATFLWHLFNILMVAWIFVKLAEWLVPHAGLLGSLFGSFIMVTLPAMVCPIETLGMEVPLMAASLWAGTLVTQGRYSAAAGAAFLAFLMKASGIVISLAILVFSLLALVAFHLSPREEQARNARMGFGVSVAMLLIERRLMQWADDPVLDMPDLDWPEVLSLSYSWYWCPDLVIYTFLATLLGIAKLLLDARRNYRSGVKPLAIPAKLIDENGIVLMSGIVVWGAVAATGSYMFMVRYVLLAVPFLIAALVIGLFVRATPRWLAIAIMGAILLGNFLNQEGRLYVPIEDAGRTCFANNSAWYPRFCPFTERSGEYRADLEATLRLIDFLSTQPRETPILADWELVQILVHPKPGYHHEAFTNAVNGEQFNNAMDFIREQLVNPNASQIPIVYVSSIPPRPNLPNPARVPVEVLFRDGHHFETAVYRAAPPSTTSVIEIEDWYLDASWGEEWPAQRVFQRLPFLVKTSRWEKLSAYMRHAVTHADPKDDYYYPLLLNAWNAMPDDLKKKSSAQVIP